MRVEAWPWRRDAPRKQNLLATLSGSRVNIGFRVLDYIRFRGRVNIGFRVLDYISFRVWGLGFRGLYRVDRGK